MFVLAAIAVLGLLIVVHELGHFLAARLQGIRVNRFSVGFGPVLLKYQGPETEYALRALPLGGYVGFPDDDPDTTIPKDDPDLLKNRPILDRAIVISAGVIANIVFSYVILLLMVAIAGVPDIKPGVLIPSLAPQADSPANRAGLKAGDVILAVNGKDLTDVEQLRKTIEVSKNQSVDLTIERSTQKVQLKVTPDAKGKIGVSLTPNQNAERRPVKDIGEIFSATSAGFQRIVGLTFESFRQLFSGQAGFDQVAGPVGIVALTANAAQTDFFALFYIASLISFNLAIINILPLPALDGGQLAFLAIEALRGKPLPARFQDAVMQTGLVLLLGLGLFLIFKDSVTLLVNGGSMTPPP